MPSPTDYLAASTRRAGTSLAEDAVKLAPQRLASPQSDEADAPLDEMTSRKGLGSWLPAAWLDAIQANDDPILDKGGEGLDLFVKLLSDPTAASTLQQRRLAITSKEYEVVAGDDKDPRSVKAADDFRAMIDGLGFDRVTGLLHYGVWFGYAVGEGLYTIKEHDGRLIVWLEDIVVPDRAWFGFTGEGKLRFTATPTASLGGEVVPDNKFVTIRTGGTHDFAFYGVGLAHWCYWPIFFKRAALKFWALYLEKLGRPTVGVGFQESEKDDKVRKADLLRAGMSIGQDSAVLLPADTITNDLVKIYESSRSGNHSQGYKDFLAEQNEEIMRVVLGQPGTSKGVSSGLNSNQAEEHAGVKEEIVKADSDLITDAIQTTFATYLTRWNHGPDVRPPIVRRILKAGEDLNTVADRDATLDGIGIKRTEDSVKAVYGDGYVVERETPEAKAAREQALALAKGGTAPAGGNVVDLAQARRDKVAEFAAQGGETAFSPLYVSRKLLNADELIAWARKQGFKSTSPAEDLHVTVLYSKTAVDWFKMAGEGWDWADLTVEAGGPRFVERFGHGNDAAVVLRFASPALTYRHDSMIERGASSDYDDYKAHVTISYDGADIDLAQVEPFTGELRFGPEIFEPIRNKPVDPDFHAFTAKEEQAIERLIAASVDKASPLFEAIGASMRGALQGVTTVEGARVALLEAIERFDPRDLAEAIALPLLGVRSAALVGADDEVKA